MPQDPLESLLRRSPMSDAQRAEAWDAVESATTPEELERNLKALKIPDRVKADLWDTKSFGDAPAAAKTEPAAPKSATERFIGGAAEMLNPVTMVEGIYQSVRHPIDTVMGLASQMGEQIQQGAQAGREGRYAEALGRTVAGAVPIMGPLAAGIAEEAAAGDIAGAAGKTVGLLVGPKVYGAALKVPGAIGRRAAGMMTNANPAMAEAVQYGMREGIPVDLATATGNPAVRGAQYLADRSLGGSVVSTGAQQATEAALKSTAGKLTARAHPSPQTPEGVGEAVRGAVKGEIRAQKARADENYARLREIEEASAPEVTTAAPFVSQVDRPFVLRWLADDLRNMPFEEGRVEHISARPKATRAEGDGRGDLIFTPRAAGTPTQKMFEKAGFTGSRAEIASQIESALTGKRKNPRLEALADALVEAWDGEKFDTSKISDAALVKTGLRRPDFESPRSVPSPETPGFDKFYQEPGTAQPTVAAGPKLAVNLKAFKESMQPILERLQKKREMTGALLGGEGRAYMALDNLVSGPDYQSLSVVDAALSDLKGLARGSVMPELRNKGQGVAAAAVRDLDTLVQLRAEEAGPEAFAALQHGRAATVAKYGAADVLKSLRKEPVQIFNQATWARDAGIDRLRAVAKLAPNEMRQVGRAYLEDLFDTATKKGGFGKTGTIATKWQNLGPETKAILFPDAPLRADLDRFFLLAEKMATNPNPSGTGYLVSLLTQGGLAVTNPASLAVSVLSGAAASKAMHSPRVVKLLTQGLKTPARGMAAQALSKNLAVAIRAAQGARQATSPSGSQSPSTAPAQP